MALGSNKKAIVHRFDREPLAGFVSSGALISGNDLQFLSPDGVLQAVPASQVKAISVTRDWSETRAWTKTSYGVRPRHQGLWVRMQFRDGEVLEATMPNNLLGLESECFSIMPPDPPPGMQRLYIPRVALTEFEVLGVVGSPLKKPMGKNKAPSEGQLRMFE
jgi:hypothetical protein